MRLAPHAAGTNRLYSRKLNPRTGKRRNLGKFNPLAAATQHERKVQFFERKGLRMKDNICKLIEPSPRQRRQWEMPLTVRFKERLSPKNLRWFQVVRSRGDLDQNNISQAPSGYRLSSV